MWASLSVLIQWAEQVPGLSPFQSVFVLGSNGGQHIYKPWGLPGSTLIERQIILSGHVS